MRVVIAILLAVFLPLAALTVVLTEPMCRAIAEASVAQDTADSATREYLVDVALAVRDFSLGNDAAAMPVGEDYRTAITPDAIAHLLDVRAVFMLAQAACVILFVLLLILTIVLVRRKGSGALARPLIVGGAVPLAAAALLGLAVAIDFNAFFTWMHSLFFAEGTWTFPANSLLIQSLPYGFWVGCALVWAGCMALLCVLSLVTGILLKLGKAQRTTA